MTEINPQYLPLSGKPFTISMGLRSLDLANWLEFDEHFSAELELKIGLYQTKPDQVFAHLDRGLAGSAETLALIKQHLDAHPEVVSADRNPLVKGLPEELAEHPLVKASLLVQEDLCVMSKIDGQWILTAASVCFPSRWDLTEKIGTSLAQIHAPVPHYAERIGQATEAMFDKFEVDRPVWRLNWTILDSPELFQPNSSLKRTEYSDDLNEFAQQIFLRIERQTLRVLPETKDVLFTIRTYVDSLANIAQRYPDFQSNLAPTLLAASAETRAYKGWPPLWQRLISWSELAN